MVNEVAIGWDNRVNSSVLTADTGVNQTTMDNLKTDDIRELWVAATLSPAIKVDFGAPISWGGCALINTNARSGDEMRIRLSTTDPVGVAGDAYDSGLISMNVDPIFGIMVHFPTSPPRIGRYFRIDLEQQDTPTAGRLFAGPVWLSERSFSYGWRPLWRDPSRRTESLGQVIYVERKLRYRGFGFTLTGISESEADDQVHELNRVCGTSHDILVCRDISNVNPGKVTVWGLLEQPVSYPQQHPDHFVAEFEVFSRV